MAEQEVVAKVEEEKEMAKAVARWEAEAGRSAWLQESEAAWPVKVVKAVVVLGEGGWVE